MKFRRKAADDVIDESATEIEPKTGPFDYDDLVEDPDNPVGRVDLGSLLLLPDTERELRLQVDERSNEVQSVILAGSEGALEIRAFAAPRNGDLWEDVRPQIAEDTKKRGGTVTEREGRYGLELLCEVPVKRPEGGEATQVSRVVGVNGDRWLLRATFLGQPAVSPDQAEDWEAALEKVVVRRGAGAMPVGEALPLQLPDQARRVGPAK